MNDKNNTSDSNTPHVTQKPHKITRRIGATTFEVSVHFSETSKEDMNDKILRLISNDSNKRKE